MATNKIDKNKKNIIEGEIVENTLLPFNPLMASPMISVDDENNMKGELIEEAQSLAVLNRQVLEAKQRETELIVDNRKLDAAKKLIEGINLVADTALSKEAIEKMLSQDNLKPMDLKFMAESMEKMANTLKSLMNPSVADEFGNRKRTKIVAQFQSATGEKTSIGVEMND